MKEAGPISARAVKVSGADSMSAMERASSSSSDESVVKLWNRSPAHYNGLSSEAIRSSMEPEQKKVYDFFRDAHNLIRMDTPAVTKLSSKQKAALFVVEDPKDWYDYAPIVETEVNDYGLLSFDFEWYGEHTGRMLPSMYSDWRFKKRIVFVHFATASGKTCFFDLEKMRGGNPVDPMHPLQSLPDVFAPWLRDPTVIKVGSEISVDALASKLTVRGTVDTRRVFAEYQKVERGQLINVGITAKTGTGIQALWVKNCDFKPMTRTKYEKTYGRSPYPDWEGQRVWPLFRRPTQIYKWPQKLDGSFRDEVYFYNWHDATTQVGLPSKLFLEDTERQGRCPIGVNDTVESTIFKYLGEFKVGIEEEQEGMQLEEEENWDAEIDKILQDGDYDDAFDDVDTSEESGQQPPRKRQRSSLRQLTGQAPAYICHWNRDIDRNNPYQYSPVWGRRCEFCGVGGHSVVDTKGVLMCPRRKETPVGEQVCIYPLCDQKDTHKVLVCPKLHEVCSKCLHRGHNEEEYCQDWSERNWADKKQQFEDFAQFGLFTKRRHHDDRWGFYAARFGSPYPYPVYYRDLIKLPVSVADELLSAQRAHVRVTAKGPGMAAAAAAAKEEPSSGRLGASRSKSHSSPEDRRPPPPAAPLSAWSNPRRFSSASATRQSAFSRLGARVSSPEPGTSRSGTSARAVSPRSASRPGRSGRPASPRPGCSRDEDRRPASPRPSASTDRSRSRARPDSPDRRGSRPGSSKASSSGSDDSVRVIRVVERRSRRSDDDPDYRPTARKSTTKTSKKK